MQDLPETLRTLANLVSDVNGIPVCMASPDVLLAAAKEIETLRRRIDVVARENDRYMNQVMR